MMNNLFDIKGNVTVITGGTGVLGREIARYLAHNGAKVIIMGRKEEVGREIVDRISSENPSGSIEFMKTDVLNREVLEANRDAIMARYGRIDTLLNAAGGNMPGATIGPDSNFFNLDPEQFRTVLDLNLTGTVLPTQVFLKPMVDAGKGAIINFSSMAAFRPLTRVCGYAAAKAGISNFTAFMATECAKKFGEGIRVNAIAPGFFIGDQNRRVLINPDGSLTNRSKKVLAKTPMNRFGDIKELNGAVQFLCSEAASFVTGAMLPIDGGFSAFSGV